MVLCQCLVPAKERGNTKLLTLHLYSFHITIITMQLLEFLYQEDNGVTEGNLYKLEYLLVYFPVFKGQVNEYL